MQDFETALELLKTLPGGPERDRLELQVLSPLGTAYIAVRGYAAPEVGPVFQRARELCDKIGEPQQQFAVVFGNFAWRIVRGEMDLSLTLAQEAHRARRTARRSRRLDGSAVPVGRHAVLSRRFRRRARSNMRGRWRNYDDRERTRVWAPRVGEDAGVTHRCYLALTLWHLGYPDQALKLSRETRELARAIEPSLQPRLRAASRELAPSAHAAAG